jgi:hypothetical protein
VSVWVTVTSALKSFPCKSAKSSGMSWEFHMVRNTQKLIVSGGNNGFISAPASRLSHSLVHYRGRSC